MFVKPNIIIVRVEEEMGKPYQITRNTSPVPVVQWSTRLTKKLEEEKSKLSRNQAAEAAVGQLELVEL